MSGENAEQDADNMILTDEPESLIDKLHVSSINVDPSILEEAKAFWLDEDYMVEQSDRLYRWKRGERRYFRIKENEEGHGVDWFNSVTTVIKHTSPKNDYLIKWIADMGYDRAIEYRDERAAYGTFLHIMIERFLIEGELNLDIIGKEIEYYIEKEGVKTKTDWFEDRVKKDLLSFAKFAVDCQLKPRAIELVLASDKHGIAGAIDFYGEMTLQETGDFGEVYKSGEKKGQPKLTKGPVNFNAIIDWKSSLKGFYDDNSTQVLMYSLLWKENFPDLLVDRVYLWRPNDWRTNPDYQLKEATDFRTQEQIEAQLNYANAIVKKEPSGFSEISGTIKLGEESENVREYTPESYVLETMVVEPASVEQPEDKNKQEEVF